MPECWTYQLHARPVKAREPSLGYPDAFSAQMLNQQLFFQHFPSAREESIRRMRELMILIRRENPGITLVMSPIPSYELAGRAAGRQRAAANTQTVADYLRRRTAAGGRLLRPPPRPRD